MSLNKRLINTGGAGGYTPPDASNAVLLDYYSFGQTYGGYVITSIIFTEDGSIAYLTTTNRTHKLVLNTPFVLSSGWANTQWSGGALFGSNLQQLTLNASNSELNINIRDTNTWQNYFITKSLDVGGNVVSSTTQSYYNFTPDFGGSINAAGGIQFINYGTQALVRPWLTNQFGTYNLSTPYDLSTLSLSFIASNLGSPQMTGGFSMSIDGTRLFVSVDDGVNPRYVVRQFTLSTPYDIRTATYDSIDLYTSYNNNTSAILQLTDNDKKVMIQGVASGPFRWEVRVYDL